MKLFKPIALFSVILLICSALINVEVLTSENSISLGIDSSEWIAPAEADELKNPIVSGEEVLSEGMLIYKKNCRSCHGRSGNGQGVGAEDCKVPVPDFTKGPSTKQSDGSMFWKIQTGRNDMAAYKGELDDEEIWKVIILLRTFSQTTEE